MQKPVLFSLLILVLAGGCDPDPSNDGQYRDLGLEWVGIDSINRDLPEGITVYQTATSSENLRAWYVRVQEPLPDIESRVLVSTDTDRRETVSEFAERLQAPVLINGGYFRMDLDPAEHVGILKVDGKVIHAATPSVLRGEQRFYLHRSAIGFGPDDYMGIGWVSSQNDEVFTWERPVENMPDVPGARVDTAYRNSWPARDVLGGGPLLIRDGKIDIAVNEEVFFGTSIPKVHPRTAACITGDDDLILLLVDGRQFISRGVDLTELASILIDLGCEEALNLDGGGSSALVVNGTLLNRPEGGTSQREVMSAIAVFSR